MHKHVVVVGGGFAGLQVVRSLRNTSFAVTLIDKTNHHLFQPLLYQVATAALSPADIAVPLRGIVHGCSNTNVLLDEVIGVQLEQRQIFCKRSGAIEYDSLVLAPGTHPWYFGNADWGRCALGLKTLVDALEICHRIFYAYEQAAITLNFDITRAWTTFVVIGGGPTGFELAGALAEIGRHTMRKDFPILEPASIRIFLIEAGSRILPSFPAYLSAKASEVLEEFGVAVYVGQRVIDVTCDAVRLDSGEIISARTTIWAAGNCAPPWLRTLGVPLDRIGRVIVERDCSVPGYSEVFVIGDASCFRDEYRGELPALAPVALQQGRFVARLLQRNMSLPKHPRFRYRDKGMLATIGRARAVAAFP